MTVLESKLLKCSKPTPKGEIGYTMESQSKSGVRNISISIDEDFYKENYFEIEKDVLNFIRYSVLGYTDDEIDVVKVLPHKTTSLVTETFTLNELEIKEIIFKYGDLTPDNIREWRKKLSQTNEGTIVNKVKSEVFQEVKEDSKNNPNDYIKVTTTVN